MKKVIKLILIIGTIAFIYWSSVKSPWAFFTQEVADILEPPEQEIYSYSISDESSVDVDALISENPEFWGQFNIDENGFCTPRNSLFNIFSHKDRLPKALPHRG